MYSRWRLAEPLITIGCRELFNLSYRELAVDLLGEIRALWPCFALASSALSLTTNTILIAGMSKLLSFSWLMVTFFCLRSILHLALGKRGGMCIRRQVK